MSLFLGVSRISSLPLSVRVFAISLSTCTVSNSLSPMLLRTGTTVYGRRKLFNRPRSISSFSSLSKGRLVRHAHDSQIVSMIIGSTPPHTPPGFVPLLGYNYNPFIRLADYCPQSPSRPRLPRLHPSVMLCPGIALPRWPMSTPWHRSNIPHGIGPSFSPGFPQDTTLVVFLLVSVSGPGQPADASGPVSFVERFLILVGVYGNSFPVDSSPCSHLIFLLCPRQVVRVGFLILCGWRAVGPIPEGLGLMAFSMVLGRIHSGDVEFFLFHSQHCMRSLFPIVEIQST